MKPPLWQIYLIKDDDMKLKPIFNSFLAKQLLKKGNKIIDLQKNYKVKNASVFYFEITDKFLSDLKDLTSI